MKHLKIENNSGYYSIDGSNWKAVDEINKEDMLKLVEHAILEEFEMDAFQQDTIRNPAHRIIYKHLHEKLNQLKNDRSRFKDESEALYKTEIDKYSL